MRSKSQWDILTQGACAHVPDREHKRKTKVLQVDWNRKTLRPNGQYMTDVEWAALRIATKQGLRALDKCRCHGKCLCNVPKELKEGLDKAIEATFTPSNVPAKTVHDLRQVGKNK